MTLRFGTDGVRGIANRDLTPELAFDLGRAGATVLAAQSERHRPVVVGRDTRISGSMLEAALVAGITSVGRDVVLLGIVPTPAVACVTRAEEAAAGVVISASHNPVPDNGIKFFGSDGFKLADAVEHAIEAVLAAGVFDRPTGTQIGTARGAANLTRHYYRQLSQGRTRLDGLVVVVDAACGAAYAIAPYVLRRLGAEVIEMNCEPDGARINVASGATHLEALQHAVRARNAGGTARAIGVAFDGDADRVLFVDETGAAVSGDHVMYAIARDAAARGELTGNAVVGTVMSNLGFARALHACGIELIRTAVGDRYVIERMRAGGYVLGGEQSGHVIDLRRNTTGDGPMTAVALLGILAASGGTLRALVEDIVVAPQVLRNVRTDRKDVLERATVRRAVAEAEGRLGAGGRVLIRASGTEPLIRVMAEGDDHAAVEQAVAVIVAQIEEEIASLTKT